MWGQGSNADVALDDIAIGAACFDTGKLLLTSHHKMLEIITKTPFNCGSKIYLWQHDHEEWYDTNTNKKLCLV